MKTTALIALLALPLSAQTVNPDRPYLTYFACTPDKGATQVELGGYRAQADDKSVFTSTPVLVRYGLFENFEVRASFDGYTRFKSPDGVVDPSGYGDLTAGAKWVYGSFFGIKQAVMVTHKFQTASVAKGLSSGAEDTTAGLLLSKEVGTFCFDANILNTWMGRTDGQSTVSVPAVSLVIKPSELGVVMHCTGEGDVVVELQVKPPVEAAHIDVTVKDWTDRPTSGM